jgi:hypothetical protein
MVCSSVISPAFIRYPFYVMKQAPSFKGEDEDGTNQAVETTTVLTPRALGYKAPTEYATMKAGSLM